MDQTMHLVDLTKEEIIEIMQSMDFTRREGQDGDPEVWENIYEKLDNALQK